MAERVQITAPDVAQSGSLEEWIRSIAQSVRRLIADRPSGKFFIDSPAAFSASQNDYNHGDVDVLRVSSSAPVDMTGFASTGQSPFVVANVGSNDITLVHESTNSAASNRMSLLGGFDKILGAGASFSLWYDTEDARWRGLVDS